MQAERASTDNGYRYRLAAPVHPLDELDLVTVPQLQPFQRAQAKLIWCGTGLLVFDAALDGRPSVKERLDELVHGTASLAVDNPKLVSCI